MAAKVTHVLRCEQGFPKSKWPGAICLPHTESKFCRGLRWWATVSTSVREKERQAQNEYGGDSQRVPYR